MNHRCNIFRFTKFDSEMVIWSRNLLLHDSVLDEDAKESLQMLQNRHIHSKLKSLAFCKKTLQKTRRNIPNPSSLPSVDPPTRSDVAEVFFFMSFMSPTSSNQSFQLIVPASSSLTSILNQFPCRADYTCEQQNFQGQMYSNKPWLLLSSNNHTTFSSDEELTFTIYQRIYKSEKLSWSDLELRPFLPYTLTHNGVCTHILTIQQIIFSRRQFSESQLLQAKDKRFPCRICEQFNGVVVVTNDPFLPDNPSFICMDCNGHLPQDHFDDSAKFTFQGR